MGADVIYYAFNMLVSRVCEAHQTCRQDSGQGVVQVLVGNSRALWPTKTIGVLTQTGRISGQPPPGDLNPYYDRQKKVEPSHDGRGCSC